MTGAPANAFVDAVRSQFWQLQVPMLVMESPTGIGVDGITEYGERVHFPDQTAIQFFLVGYRLGEDQAQAPPPEGQYDLPFGPPTPAEAELSPLLAPPFGAPWPR